MAWVTGARRDFLERVGSMAGGSARQRVMRGGSPVNMSHGQEEPCTEDTVRGPWGPDWDPGRERTPEKD